MKYSIFVAGDGVAYIHQSGHTKEKAEHIAKILNDSYSPKFTTLKAFVMTDKQAKDALIASKDTSYFVVLEDGHVVFIEITQEMRETIDKSYDGDEEAYFAEVICEEYEISYNNCQWSITSESCIACYGKLPNITI